MNPLTLWSLGHSNVPLAEVLALLGAHGIERVADVRRFPVSRRNPQFARESLALALGRAGVQYTHLSELGGHREERPGSEHTALRPGPFRGYADHMRTEEFARGLERLLGLARERRTAMMCAEKRFDECHRRFLCDALLLHGARILHVRNDAPAAEHALHPAARVTDGRIVYVRAQPRGLFD